MPTSSPSESELSLGSFGNASMSVSTGKLNMSVPLEVKDIITANTAIFARQRPEEGGNIKFLNVVLSDRAKADSAIKAKATKWTPKLGSVFAKKK